MLIAKVPIQMIFSLEAHRFALANMTSEYPFFVMREIVAIEVFRIFEGFVALCPTR
jgi:hypothetical protein